MGGMFLEILPQGHRLLDHLLVKLGGIEQMELTIAPDGESEVGDVETFLVTGDGDDITILDGLTHQGDIARETLGDISETLSGDLLLHLADIGNILRMLAQRLIAVGMFTHERNGHLLPC